MNSCSLVVVPSSNELVIYVRPLSALFTVDSARGICGIININDMRTLPNDLSIGKVRFLQI